MIHFVAQTRPALPEIPASWTAFLAAITGLLTAISVLLGLVMRKQGKLEERQTKTEETQGTQRQNTQTLAAGVLSLTKAVNDSPAVASVPSEVAESARAIRNDPTTPAPVPCKTDPEPPKIQT